MNCVKIDLNRVRNSFTNRQRIYFLYFTVFLAVKLYVNFNIAPYSDSVFVKSENITSFYLVELN